MQIRHRYFPGFGSDPGKARQMLFIVLCLMSFRGDRDSLIQMSTVTLLVILFKKNKTVCLTLLSSLLSVRDRISFFIICYPQTFFFLFKRHL